MKNNATPHGTNAKVGRTWSASNEMNNLPDNFRLGMINETAETGSEP